VGILKILVRNKPEQKADETPTSINKFGMEAYIFNASYTEV
jgi:hypothetical protein